MAAVTQTIPNFLGGVSRQTDYKKLPGQVRECLNAYPDPTFGLMKRPGFKFIKTLHESSNPNSPDFADAKWFFIKRDNEETYFGNIKAGASGTISIWNKDGGVAAVTDSSSSSGYLDTTRDNYDVLTVQDTTIITNKTKAVTAQAAPSGDDEHIINAAGTVALLQVSYSCKYSVSLKVGNTTYNVNYTTINGEDLSPSTDDPPPQQEKALTADHILAVLEGGGSAPYNAGLKDLSISGHTLSVQRLPGTLELSLVNDSTSKPVAFTLTAADSQTNANITAYNETITSVADLPKESKHNRKLKIINSGGVQEVYWVTFNADNNVNGPGVWEETIDPTVSPGLNSTTLPHELRWTGTNAFTYQKAPWVDRVVGDGNTNSHPSFCTTDVSGNFVGKIQQTFFHNNRLGILTEDNVSMSKSDDFYNFYFTSALATTDADPIDISCSSIRPAVLHGVLPTAQGLILFSRNQQFILFSDAEVLTPATAVIRGISNYEMDPNIDPVETGTILHFVSKTPSYTRIFGMQTRGAEESPLVVDIGKIVSEWVPDTVTSLLSSPQNSLIALYGPSDNIVYFYKTYTVGDRTLMQAWFKWDLPGNVQHASIDSDTMWAIVEDKGKYHLISASLTQTPEETIMTTADGQQINPHMDMYTAATNGAAGASEKKVVYDAAGNFSKCYIPYADLTARDPVILIAGNATQDFAGVTEYGFTVNPTRVTDGSDVYFKVEGKDLSAQADNVYVGYQYNYDVELPRTYYKLNPEGSQYDYTSSLTIARMKFALGLSSVVGFKVKSKGYRGDIAEFTGDGTTTAFTVPFVLKKENGIKVTLDGAKQASTAYTYTTTDTTSTVTFTTAPEKYTVSRLYGGSGYTAANGVATTSANGTGLTVDTTVSGGAVTGVTIHGGSGYVEGEVVSINGGTGGGFVVGPAQKIAITTDTWYDVQTSQDVGQYLADDVPLSEDNVFTIPIHQRSDNFNIRVFSNSPFPVALTSMMWEGQYSPRFYRRS